MEFYKPEKVLEPLMALQKLSESQNIALVTGCFDVLHFGHISYLREAKKIAGVNGKVVVVVHDDESIKVKKGEDRPINILEKRIEVLSELESVDYIIPWYGWESVQDFVLQLSPDFLVVTKSDTERKNMDKIRNHKKIKIMEIPKIYNFSSTFILGKLGL